MQGVLGDRALLVLELCGREVAALALERDLRRGKDLRAVLHLVAERTEGKLVLLHRGVVGVLRRLPLVPCLHLFVIPFIVVALRAAVVVFLVGVVERLFRGVEVVARRLCLFQILLHIHGGKLLRRDGRQCAERERRGQLLADHRVELAAKRGDVHVERRLAALKLNLARLCLLERHGADLPELIAQLQLRKRAVQRRVLPRERGGLLLKPEEGYVGGLRHLDGGILHVFELVDDAGVVLLQLAVAHGVELLAQRIVLCLERLVRQRSDRGAYGADRCLRC